MKIEQLEFKLQKLGIDKNNYRIGDRGYYDGRFNLIHHDNGKWEIFYGTRGQKKDQSVYDSESVACEAFLELLKSKIGSKELEDKPKYWKGYRKRSIHEQHIIAICLFILSILLGLFFAGYQAYIRQFNFVFWFFVIWVLSFGFLLFCWLNDRTYELFEHIVTPLVFGLLILGFAAGMIAAPFFIIPQIQSGGIGKDYYVSLAFAELVFGAAVWAFYRFFIKDYVDELKDRIKSKKNKEQP